MMDKIFHYGYCSNCNSMKNNVRRELCHILPPQVCEVISDYNVYCYGCRKAKNNEKMVIERGISKGMCEMEMIIYHFTRNKPKPFFADSSKTVKVGEMNEIIDFYESEDMLMNKVMKKFFKDHYFILTVFIMSDVSDTRMLHDKTMQLQMEEDGYFSYNRRLYAIRPLITCFFSMYLIDIIDSDDHLVDTGKVMRYINDHVGEWVE